jgi:hypothetical protein
MYLLDANVFIEAKNTYFAFDTTPGYWEWLPDANRRGILASVPAVRTELEAQDDELSRWAHELPTTFWVPETAGTVAALRTLAGWADSGPVQYRPSARAEFLGSADLRLIAEALGGGHTVVTREQPAPASKRRILIPDVCVAHGVALSTPFEVHRRAGLRLARQSEAE